MKKLLPLSLFLILLTGCAEPSSNANYEEMKKNLLSLATDYKIEASTNFGVFLKRFEDNKTNWIDEINKRIGDY